MTGAGRARVRASIVGGVALLALTAAPVDDPVLPSAETATPARAAEQAAAVATPPTAPPTTAVPTTTSPPTTAAPAPTRSLTVYQGLGAWIDVFDYAPAYQTPPGTPAPITPAFVDELAARGVRTLFLQATRNDARSPHGIVDHDLIGRFLERAHARGIAVVGWYLPTFASPEVDLANLVRIHELAWHGHRFDGIAVDIEANRSEPDHAVRSARLVDLSRRLRAVVGDEPLGAIVLPPLLLEAVNPRFWPGFPWAELADVYDVWLPMSYWTDRTRTSGFREPYRYSTENVARLHALLGRAAPVHLIGGVGDRAADADYAAFSRAVVDTGAIGASVYDARTTTAAGWHELQRLFG